MLRRPRGPANPAPAPQPGPAPHLPSLVTGLSGLLWPGWAGGALPNCCRGGRSRSKGPGCHGGCEAARSGVPVLGMREPEEKAGSCSLCPLLCGESLGVRGANPEKSRQQQKLSWRLVPSRAENPCGVNTAGAGVSQARALKTQALSPVQGSRRCQEQLSPRCAPFPQSSQSVPQIQAFRSETVFQRERVRRAGQQGTAHRGGCPHLLLLLRTA